MSGAVNENEGGHGRPPHRYCVLRAYGSVAAQLPDLNFRRRPSPAQPLTIYPTLRLLERTLVDAGQPKGNVAFGSFASAGPDHGDFGSTPVNGHSQDGRACLKGARFSHSVSN
jgi:hypothetical protein